MPLWRLDKIIASQTSLSRKDVKAVITGGRVQVDGNTALRGEQKFDTETAFITVDGRQLIVKEYIYLLLNKPLGYVSSTDDKDGPSVLHLVPEHLRRRKLFPAGRLDKYSEGMLVITDDGSFAHRMLSPRRHVPKRYYVETDIPVFGDELIAAFAAGVDVGEEITYPARVEPITDSKGFVTISQGLFHQLRRMFYVFGAGLNKLERIQIGSLGLDEDMPQGECRELSDEEIVLLLTKPESVA